MNVPGHKTISAGATVVAVNLPSGFYPEREVTISVSAVGSNINLSGIVRKNGEIVISNPSSNAVSYWRAFGVYYLP